MVGGVRQHTREVREGLCDGGGHVVSGLKCRCEGRVCAIGR